MTTQSSPPPVAEFSQSPRKIFGQPPELFTLSNIELWERFSFYGMQAAATIYMYTALTESGLGMEKTTAQGIIGAYGGVVFLCTVLGSWISDRLLGPERVLFISAVIIMAGHIGLAVIPGGAGLAVGLILVAIGSGGLATTSTTMVGMLYSPEDERRDAGFSIYYMAVNIGAFFGPLLTGWVRVTWGFHWAFALAAIGMALGLGQYALRRKNLPPNTRIVTDPLPAQDYKRYSLYALAAITLIVISILLQWVTVDNIPYVILVLVAVLTIAYFVGILRSAKVTSEERSRVWSFIPMFLASVAFWTLFQQQFTLILIYADTKVNRNFFGWEMPPEWVNSINPIFIILFAGVFATLWTKLGSRQPSSPAKFSLSLMIMGIAYLCFIPFANQGDNSVPLLVLVGVLFLFTLAELLLSPIGLSLSTKLSPRAFRAQMVGLFYLSLSLGSTLSGIFAQLYDPANEAPYFVWTGIAAIALGISLAVGSKSIRKLMLGVH